MLMMIYSIDVKRYVCRNKHRNFGSVGCNNIYSDFNFR